MEEIEQDLIDDPYNVLAKYSTETEEILAERVANITRAYSLQTQENIRLKGQVLELQKRLQDIVNIAHPPALVRSLSA